MTTLKNFQHIKFIKILLWSSISLIIFVAQFLAFTLIANAQTWYEGNDAQEAYTGSTWTYVQFSKLSDDQYSESVIPKKSYSKHVHVYDFNFNIPKMSKIDSIEISVEAKASNTSSLRSAIPSLFNMFTTWYYNGDIEMTYWPITDTTRTFGGGNLIDDWSPDITPDIINSHDFGATFGFTNSNLTLSRTGYIDQIKMRIAYHPYYQPDIKVITGWHTAMNEFLHIPTVYASSSCTFAQVDASTTTALCNTDATTTPIMNTTQDIAVGLILFLITFFGLIYYFKT